MQRLSRHPLSTVAHASIPTYPSVPCTRMRCPSLINRVAFSTPTTAGEPYIRGRSPRHGSSAPHLGHQALDGYEQGCPARIREGGDQDIPASSSASAMSERIHFVRHYFCICSCAARFRGRTGDSVL